jgi:hypothetical protein
MGPVRKTINLAFALALTGGGAYAIFYIFVYADAVKKWMVTAVAMVTGLGLYWLWEDFIKPAIRKEDARSE